MVQPGVSARGKKYKTTVFPRNPFRETSFPFSSGKVNSGALSWIFMDVPQRRSNLSAARPNKKADEPPFVRILHRRVQRHELSACLMAILAVAALVSAVLWSMPLAAQEDTPLIMPSEHKLPTKKDLGPRAIAILQMSAKGKVSLVPIAIMIDGKFWDATAYKADPVPMALEYGTVYEAERTGSSQGLFTVGSALRSNAANAQTPWLGTGAWVPAGTEKKDTVMKASGAAPVGLTDTDAPPRLTRDSSKVYPQSQPSGSSSSSPASSKSSSSSGSSDEPPRLSKPASEPSSNPGSSPNSTPADSKNSGSSQAGSSQSGSPQSGPAQNPSSPTATPPTPKPDTAKASKAENIPVDDSGADASGRPRLRRGKPEVSFADEEIPGYSKPGAAPPPKPGPNASAKAPSAPEPVDLIPAISDAHGPQPHSYGFEWLKGEEAQRHDQMVELAKQQLAAYLKTEAKEQITPEAHSAHALQRTAARKAAEPIFENARMVAYDLWLTNQPVLVFTADAHMPSASASRSGPYSNLTYSITIAAYPDIYNNLHKLYVGVTDKYHLDVTPKLELIDAVDADGDGRGELLFRKTSDAGTGWVIYRASADSLSKMYDSLNPE